MPESSTPVLVLGMHRSGTSYLASVLQALGVHLGDELLEADRGNPRGYYEDKALIAFHERLLAARVPESQFRSSFLPRRDFDPTLTEEEIEAGKSLMAAHQREGLWGWKDPRTCLFVDYWLEQLPNARCVAVYRHPMEVYYSFLKRRDWSAVFAPEAVFNAYATYNKILLAAREKAPDRFLVLNACAAFGNKEKLIKDLTEFLPGTKVDESKLPEFVGREFSSLGVLDEQHRLMAAVYPEAADCYDKLQFAAEEPEELSPDGTHSLLPPALLSLVAASLEAMREAGAENPVSEPAPSAPRRPLPGNPAHLHGLVESLCLNASPERVFDYKREIVDAAEAEHKRITGDRDRYIGLYEKYFEQYQRYFPLYENYFAAWKETERTLTETRDWVNSDLLPKIERWRQQLKDANIPFEE